MARRLKTNESMVVLHVPTTLADLDLRILAPGDNCRLTHWKIAKSRAGTGTAIIDVGAWTAAGGTGTRLMAAQSVDLDAAAGTITSGADAVSDVTTAEGSPIFIFLNFDAGSATAEGHLEFTLFFQS